MKFDERNQKIYKIPPFLFAWQLQKFVKFGVNLTFFTPWLP